MYATFRYITLNFKYQDINDYSDNNYCSDNKSINDSLTYLGESSFKEYKLSQIQIIIL